MASKSTYLDYIVVKKKIYTPPIVLVQEIAINLIKAIRTGNSVQVSVSATNPNISDYLNIAQLGMPELNLKFREQWDTVFDRTPVGSVPEVKYFVSFNDLRFYVNY